MSRERDAPVMEVKEKEREKSPVRDRSPPPERRRSSRSRSGSRHRSPPRGRSPRRSRSPPPRGRSPPPRRRSSRSRSRSRSPPRRRRDSRSPPPRRRGSRSRTPPRRRGSRSRSPPRRDWGRPNRDYGNNRYGGRNNNNNNNNGPTEFRGDWRRNTRERPVAKPSNVLGVFGLAPETEKEELEVIFKKYGKLKEIVLVRDRDTGLSKGFCFVYYEDQQDAEDAKAECDGSTIEGRKIRVDYSLTVKPHEPTPGQYMGNKRWDRTHGNRDDGWRGGDRDGGRDGGRGRSRSRSR